MSDSIPTLIEVDRRLPKYDQAKVTYKGPENTTFYVLPAINANTATSVFNINLPNKFASGISRVCYRRITGSCTFTDAAAGAGHLGSVAGANVTPNYLFTLRPNCVELATTSVSTALSSCGRTLTQARVGDFWVAKQHYSNGMAVAAQALSTSPVKPTRFNTFVNAANDQSSPFAAMSAVATSDYVAAPTNCNITNIEYVVNATPANGYSSCKISFEIFAPVVLGIFEVTNATEEYLFYQSQISLTIQNTFTPANLLCMYTPTAAARGTLPTFVDSGKIVFDYVGLYYSTISLSAESIPKKVLYPYRSYEIYDTASQTTPAVKKLDMYTKPAIPLTIPSQNVILSSMPYGFLVYVQPDYGVPNSTAILYPNIFLPITEITCQFNGQSGQLSNCVFANLYDLCRRNGLQGKTYPEFVGAPVGSSNAIPAGAATAPVYNQDVLNGCPIFIKSTDLFHSDSTPLVGEAGQLNVLFNVTANCQVPILNANSQGGIGVTDVGYDGAAAGVKGIEKYRLYVVVVQDNILEITNTDGMISAEQKQIYIDRSDIASARYMRQGKKQSLSGGSFWSELGDTMANIAGSFKDGLTMNIPSIIDRVTGKKKGFGEETDTKTDILRRLAKK